MVGLLEKLEFKVASHFQHTGDRVVLLGETAGRMGGSAYWTYVRDFVGGQQPSVDLEAELKLQKVLVEAARRRLLRSAHDCSTGGIAASDGAVLLRVAPVLEPLLDSLPSNG